jgi:hypothetical protein
MSEPMSEPMSVPMSEPGNLTMGELKFGLRIADWMRIECSNCAIRNSQSAVHWAAGQLILSGYTGGDFPKFAVP